MSGGYFEYKQYTLNDIKDQIERVVENNKNNDSNKYQQPTIEEFKNAISILKTASVYTQRIDWLLSGDDGEESFHARLKDELGDIDEITR